jgi:hydroxypyruvate isomerase
MLALTRRQVLAAAAATPLAAIGSSGRAEAQSQPAAAALPAPKYTLSCNIELMFPREMPHAERIERIADQGLKAFGFWGAANKDLAAMERVQQRTGLLCGSITGNGGTGWSTGLTATGQEEAFQQDFLAHIETAKRFNVKNMICFVGETQPNIPLDVQHRQVVEGLKRTGDIAAQHGVYFCLEPLNRVESPKMHVLSAQHGFRIVEEVNHPHVRLDFDMYHLQLSDGNLINNLREGLRKQWIRFVEIGDVPGRKEPGTGETNYTNIFKVLREEGFADFVGMEHGTSSTPEQAMQVVKAVAGV